MTDPRLVNLSNAITQASDLRKLGIQGLHLDAKTVERHITNNRDITSAAHDVLFEWLNTQENRRVAYNNLCKALKIVKMKLKIQDLQ